MAETVGKWTGSGAGSWVGDDPDAIDDWNCLRYIAPPTWDDLGDADLEELAGIMRKAADNMEVTAMAAMMASGAGLEDLRGKALMKLAANQRATAAQMDSYRETRAQRKP